MTDRRPKVTKSQQDIGTKRSASTNSSEPTNATPQKIPKHPTSLPPQSPHNNTFQLPTIPNLSRIANRPQKVAIPRLRREADGMSFTASSRGGDKHRINHACEPCRHRKTKCSGERPTCKHCDDFKITCVYADGKRDRVKKEFNSMAGRLEEYERLLRQLSLRVDGSDYALIQRVLDKEPASEDDDMQSIASSVRSSRGRKKSMDGEGQVSARVGSISSIDRVNEDFNRSSLSRATGYVGKNSELSWMQRLRTQVQQTSPNRGEEGERWGRDHEPSSSDNNQNVYAAHPPQGPRIENDGVSHSTYHCDDIDLVLPSQVMSNELPPRHTIQILLQTYLDSVHAFFPIIGRITFMNQVQTFLNNDHLKPGKNWMAILNLMFAIAAKYSHLVQAEWRGDDRDHLIYFARARILGMNGESIFEHPSLQHVQVLGLMAFYLLSINQINRSWIMHGTAIRHALALGLHLRNEDKNVNSMSKEIRYRVWWSLYGLERHLGIMTGRPTSISERDCSTPMPLPRSEEAFSRPDSGNRDREVMKQFRRFSSQDSATAISTPSSSQSTNWTKKSPSRSPPSVQLGHGFLAQFPPSHSVYFFHYSQLNVLSHEILTTLYCPKAITRSWSETQSSISALDRKLERWLSSLTPTFDFTITQGDPSFVRQRVSLGFFYFSNKMIIHRPCLCRMDGDIPNESNKSRDYNRNSAVSCVRAAKGMIGLLPDDADPVVLYQSAPWWCVLQCLMQAATVLMVELSFGADHMRSEAEDILNMARKAVFWLNQMAGDNQSARRAWRICDGMLRKVAPKIGRDVDDLPSTTPPSQSKLSFNTENDYDFTNDAQFTQSYSGGSNYGGPYHYDSRIDFLPTALTSYDQLMPFTAHPVTSAPPLGANYAEADLSHLFPTTLQMDGITTRNENDPRPEDYYSPNQ